MYSNPMITISPMQEKLFRQAKQMKTPQHYRSAMTFNALPIMESSLSRVTNSSYKSNTNSSYVGSLTLSHFGSQLSNLSKNSSKASITNSYIHTEYDQESKRVKASFFEKPDSGIYTGQSRVQSAISQDNYKRRFYNNQSQVKEGVIYNRYYGQNNLEIEEFEETHEPFNYFKICTRNGEIVSTSTIRPQQVASMLQNNQFMPSN